MSLPYHFHKANIFPNIIALVLELKIVDSIYFSLTFIFFSVYFYFGSQG